MVRLKHALAKSYNAYRYDVTCGHYVAWLERSINPGRSVDVVVGSHLKDISYNSIMRNSHGLDKTAMA